ncbi:PAS domain-containing protein, partial [Priestia megaterium]|uniref:PAS domain-containing protein n=1 Tax=Priestia megaterium TaxID=1404 RepID=UPI0035B58F12
VFAQDRDLRYCWVSNAGDSWLAGADEGMTDGDILSGQAAERSTAMKREVLRSIRPARFELSIATGPSVRWYDVRVDVDRDAQGEVCGLIGTSF